MAEKIRVVASLPPPNDVPEVQQPSGLTIGPLGPAHSGSKFIAGWDVQRRRMVFWMLWHPCQVMSVGTVKLEKKAPAHAGSAVSFCTRSRSSTAKTEFVLKGSKSEEWGSSAKATRVSLSFGARLGPSSNKQAGWADCCPVPNAGPGSEIRVTDVEAQ
jgi:hypothetical protein